MSKQYNSKNIPLAKTLRKNSTKQENRLWYDFLSKYEVRFQRQKAIGEFIADFYCHKANLVVEVDGSHHFSKQGVLRDESRTKRLEEYGVNVIRISNKQIDKDFASACKYIDKKVKEIIQEKNL